MFWRHPSGAKQLHLLAHLPHPPHPPLPSHVQIPCLQPTFCRFPRLPSGNGPPVRCALTFPACAPSPLTQPPCHPTSLLASWSNTTWSTLSRSDLQPRQYEPPCQPQRHYIPFKSLTSHLHPTSENDPEALPACANALQHFQSSPLLASLLWQNVPQALNTRAQL